MKFTLNIPLDKILTAKQKTITKASQKIKVKGFRQGKAPLSLVEEKLDPEYIKQAVFEETLPEILTQYLTTNNLKPITDPDISNLQTPDNADWLVDVEIAQKPTVSLKDYTKAVKTLKTKDKLWQKDKTKKSSTKETPEEATRLKNQQLDAILEALLKMVEIEIPTLMIKQDVNQRLSKLANQITKLGLSVEDYLKAQNLTAEDLQKQYATQSEKSYKLEFILQAIAADQKLAITDAEFQEKVKSITDPKLQHAISEHPEESEYYRSLLVREKTIDFLLNM